MELVVASQFAMLTLVVAKVLLPDCYGNSNGCRGVVRWLP